MAKQQAFMTRGMAFSMVQSKSLVQSKVWCPELTAINAVKLFDCRTSGIFFHRQIQMVPDISTFEMLVVFWGWTLE